MSSTVTASRVSVRCCSGRCRSYSSQRTIYDGIYFVLAAKLAHRRPGRKLSPACDTSHSRHGGIDCRFKHHLAPARDPKFIMVLGEAGLRSRLVQREVLIGVGRSTAGRIGEAGRDHRAQQGVKRIVRGLGDPVRNATIGRRQGRAEPRPPDDTRDQDERQNELKAIGLAQDPAPPPVPRSASAGRPWPGRRPPRWRHDVHPASSP